MNGPRWIKQWIADLAMLNDQFRNEDGSVDFSALGREEYQFRMALITQNFSKSQRAKDVFEKATITYEANVERGKKGGRPKAGEGALPLPTLPEAFDFANQHNLDSADTNEWYQWLIVECGGVGPDNKPIRNWKGSLTEYCKGKKNRRTA